MIQQINVRRHAAYTIQGVSKFTSILPFDSFFIAIVNQLFSISLEREIVEVGLSKKISKLHCYKISNDE